jgi:hypothetical protein
VLLDAVPDVGGPQPVAADRIGNRIGELGRRVIVDPGARRAVLGERVGDGHEHVVRRRRQRDVAHLGRAAVLLVGHVERVAGNDSANRSSSMK